MVTMQYQKHQDHSANCIIRPTRAVTSRPPIMLCSPGTEKKQRHAIQICLGEGGKGITKHLGRYK